MKTIKIFALTAVTLTVALVSCSKDETLSSPSSNISAIRTDDGVMTVLKSIKDKYGELTFNYDGEGRCTSVYDEGLLLYELSYDPFAVTAYDYIALTAYDYDVDMSFNSSGYVSKATYNGEFSGTENSYSGKGTCTFSYDGSHLTKMSGSYSETGTDEGGKYKYSYELSVALTWANGNVKKIVISEEEGTEDDWKWTNNETITFEYGDTENEYLQFTRVLMGWTLYPLGLIGYFGKGTALLPESYEWVWEDYEYEYEDGKEYSEKGSEKGEDVKSVSYTKNSDGLIKTETVDGYTYTYSYDYISPETRSMVTLPENGSPTRENAEPHRRMFDGRGQHHSPHHNNVHSHEK